MDVNAFESWAGLLPCPAGLVDADGIVVQVNEPWLDAVEKPREALIGTALGSGHDPETLADGRPHELVFRGDDGGAVTAVTASVRAIDEGELSGGYLIVFMDTTPQRELLDHVSTLSDNVLNSALDLKHLNDELERRVRLRTAELYQANMDALTMLAVASEARDSDTGAHVRRIQKMTQRVAVELGLGEDEAEEFGYAAILHDVGKIHIADNILKKPGELTPDERRIMEGHTIAGEQILGGNPFFALARVIARSHHENFDGTGYPDGLTGEEIELPARIVHVVDVYDALSHARVYKDAWSTGHTKQVLIDGRGRQFDPAVVDAFLSIVDQL